MKKLILIAVAILTLTACGNKEVSKGVLLPSAKIEVAKADIEFSDPARITGSNFGAFFLSMLRTQNYDMALKFTSKESVDKFGIDKIKDKYQNFKFNYRLTQKSIVKNVNTFTIVYATQEYATGKLKKMIVVLENDTCKLVLPENLDDFLK